jgi:predicted nuclease with TOPRIM domain
MFYCDHLQAEELQDELSSLKTDHTNNVQELSNKIHVVEEANSRLEEEAKRLSNDIAALIQAKNSLDLEKQDLEAAASKLTAELAASSVQVEDVNRLALAAKSEVSLSANQVVLAFCENFRNFESHDKCWQGVGFR